jgi:hypothetical protein
MKNDVMNSSISVPVPTDLYVSLLDLVSRTHLPGGSTRMVTAILQKYLDDARQAAPAAPSPGGTAAPAWSDEWIMFSAPPAQTAAQASGPDQSTGHGPDTDWAIGCGCPTEDLLSS